MASSRYLQSPDMPMIRCALPLFLTLLRPMGLMDKP